MKKFATGKACLCLLTLLLLGAGLLITAQSAWAEGGPVITAQPQNAEVAYPDGATFTVEVEDPDNVASWQWEMSDGYNLFVLKGVSATTNTLIVPCTQQDDPDVAYRCVITDKDGNTVASEPAILSITNKETDKTVLYVGDHAVEPGETLDLADTTMGSGTVAFAKDGINVTFTDFRMDNSVMVYDRQLAPGTGIYFVRRNSTVPEYRFRFSGECEIDNTFYDPEYNSAGVDLNAFFGSSSSSDHPTIILEGGASDSLHLKGGTNAIYTDGNIEIDLKVTCEPNGTIFMDGIRCHTLILDEGASVELNTNGTGVFALGDLRLFRNASLDLVSKPATVSVGATAKSIILLGGSLYADGAGISIDGYGDPSRFVPNGQYLSMMNGVSLEGVNSTVNLKGSYLNIFLHAGESEEPFAVNFNGIIGTETGNSLLMEDGVIHVTVDAPQVEGCGAIVLGGKAILESASRIELYVNGKGEAHGMEVGNELEMKDSQIRSEIVSTNRKKTYGVLCGSAKIEGNVQGKAIESEAKNGVAFGADTGTRTTETIPYAAGYEPVKIVLKGDNGILTPEGGVFALAAVPGFDAYIETETVFDPLETRWPAETVVIGTTFPFPFKDVKVTDYFRTAVDWAYRNGITGGKTETLFAPNDTATRAQMVTFLWAASNKPEPKTKDNPFTDVSSSAYYYKAVLWAVEKGITAGISEDKFGPDLPVTRAQAMTLLYGSLGRPEADPASSAPAFEDVTETDYFAAPVAWAAAKGVTSGTTPTTFGPDDPCTRAQIVTFLYLTYAKK